MAIRGTWANRGRRKQDAVENMRILMPPLAANTEDEGTGAGINGWRRGGEISITPFIRGGSFASHPQREYGIEEELSST